MLLLLQLIMSTLREPHGHCSAAALADFSSLAKLLAVFRTFKKIEWREKE